MTKLKPCPFCGCDDVYETYRQEYSFGSKAPIIFCNICKMEFSVEDDSPYIDINEDYKYRKKKTADAWNRRASK